MAPRSRLSQSIFGFKVLCEDPEQKELPIEQVRRQLELNRFLGALGLNGKKIRHFAIGKDKRTLRMVLSEPLYGAESIDFYLAKDETELTAEKELCRFWEYMRDQIARWDSMGEFTKPRVEVYSVDDLPSGLVKVCLRAFPEYIGTEKQVWNFVKPSSELPFCVNVQRLFEAVNGALKLRRVGTKEDPALECRTNVDDETGRLDYQWALYQPMIGAANPVRRDSFSFAGRDYSGLLHELFCGEGRYDVLKCLRKYQKFRLLMDASERSKTFATIELI